MEGLIFSSERGTVVTVNAFDTDVTEDACGKDQGSASELGRD